MQRPSWRDSRLLVGVLLVLAATALGAKAVASADDRIGTYDEWADQEALDRLGVDKGVIQLMLLETNTRYLLDYARIRQRGGFLTFYDKKPQDLIGPPLREYAQRLIGLSH